MMITVCKVNKSYPNGIEVLRDVSFNIENGEFIYLTGHSGAGKTTLLRLLAAIEKPTSGSIIVNNVNLASLNHNTIPYLRRNFGLVFQDHKLLFDRSILANVLLPLTITGLSRKEATHRAMAALEKVGLDEPDRMPIALSGGEQQRLAIARAVVNRPTVLLADEPTGNLDSESAAMILDLFLAFHKIGVTVIVATHDPRPFSGFTPRRFTISEGRIIHDDNNISASISIT